MATHVQRLPLATKRWLCGNVRLAHSISESSPPASSTAPVTPAPGTPRHVRFVLSRAVFATGARIRKNEPCRTPTAEALRLQKDFANGVADPLNTLRCRLEVRTADIDIAKACLDGIYARVAKLPRRPRSEQVRNGEVGRLVLKWLWSTDDLWSTAVLTDYKFVEMLCYFAVAEGLEDLLISWMAQEMPHEDLSEPDRWRGALLQGLVLGHMLLDYQHRADDAIRAFLEIHASILEARQIDRPNLAMPLARTFIWPAAVAISKQLTTGYKSKTSTGLFDEFVRIYCTMPWSSDLDMARLSLFQPTRPDPDHAFTYIRATVGHMSKEQYEKLHPPGCVDGTALYLLIRRAEAVLRKQGKAVDADLLKKLTVDLLSDDTRRALEEYHDDMQRKMPAFQQRLSSRSTT